MAQSFFYPMSQSIATNEGEFVGIAPHQDFVPTSGDVTNEWHLTNNSIGHTTEGFGLSEVVRFDLGSAQEITHIAIYHSGGTSANLSLFYSPSNDNGTDMGTSSNMPASTTPAMTTYYNAGWNIRKLDASATKRYWCIRADINYFNPSEIMFCKEFAFPQTPEISTKTSHTFGEDIKVSWYGREYVNKAHEITTTWDWIWKSVSSSTKNNLEDIRDKIYDYKKFIYYDGQTYHWVRLTKDFEYTEVALNIFDVKVTLERQLS